MIDKFLTSNATGYRLARTIIQGLIGVLIANADVIFSGLHMSGGTKAIVVAMTMAILSPIMGALSSNGKTIEAYTAEAEDGDVEAVTDRPAEG